jgi:LuxR family transcriptional regulator
MRNYLHFLSNCQSIETLWEAHVARMDDYGFDRLIYGFTRYSSSSSLGDPEGFILLTNHDKAYTDVFVGEQRYAQAPMVN